MATVVAVMDRDEWGANTDNIVVVDRRRRLLLWVPRDLWCEGIQHRINKAFARGGHDQLLRCLADLGISAQHCVCVRRSATEKALSQAHVRIPVRRRYEFWYPLEPEGRCEDGRKPVDFEPPFAVLTGERLHQWAGARRSRDGRSSDLDRIRRQHVLVRAMLRQGFDFGRVLQEPELVRISGPEALKELSRVRAWWRFRCFEGVRPERVRGMEVLVATPPSPLARRLIRRLRPVGVRLRHRLVTGRGRRR